MSKRLRDPLDSAGRADAEARRKAAGVDTAARRRSAAADAGSVDRMAGGRAASADRAARDRMVAADAKVRPLGSADPSAVVTAHDAAVHKAPDAHGGHGDGGHGHAPSVDKSSDKIAGGLIVGFVVLRSIAINAWELMKSIGGGIQGVFSGETKGGGGKKAGGHGDHGGGHGDHGHGKKKGGGDHGGGHH